MIRWLSALLAMGALLTSEAAFAAVYPSQGAAYSACLTANAATLAQLKASTDTETAKQFTGKCITGSGQSQQYGRYASQVLLRGSHYGFYDYFDYLLSNSCSAQPDIVNARFNGSASSCSGGCAYTPVLGGGELYSVTKFNGVPVTRASRLAPTGEACSVTQETPDSNTGEEDQCTQQGHLTQCVKKDGSICTQASTGRQFCWSPGENGIKTSGNQAASKVPDGKDSKVPPVPPKNGGDWEKVGETSVSISDTKNGSTTTNNSTINNYNSSYGSSGSGASGNGASGESNGGSGDGSGSGSGDGEGGGDGNDPGGAGSGVGTLYEGSGDTVAGVFDQFKARVGNSPLIAATRDFFTVHGGGSCPVFTVPASTYWESMTYDGHCSGDFLAALKSIGWVLMAIAALAAAYWALS